jgi:hypothetical protein
MNGLVTWIKSKSGQRWIDLSVVLCFGAAFGSFVFRNSPIVWVFPLLGSTVMLVAIVWSFIAWILLAARERDQR